MKDRFGNAFPPDSVKWRTLCRYRLVDGEVNAPTRSSLVAAGLRTVIEDSFRTVVASTREAHVDSRREQYTRAEADHAEAAGELETSSIVVACATNTGNYLLIRCRRVVLILLISCKRVLTLHVWLSRICIQMPQSPLQSPGLVLMLKRVKLALTRPAPSPST